MYFARFMMVTVFLMSWHTTDAAVYKCKNSDGQTSYSENRCAGDLPVAAPKSDLTEDKVRPPVSNPASQIVEPTQKISFQIAFVHVPILVEKSKSNKQEIEKKLHDSFSEYQNLLVLTPHTDVMYVNKNLDLTEAIINDNYSVGENTKKKLNGIARNLKIGFINLLAISEENVNPEVKAAKKRLESEFSQSDKEGKLDKMKFQTRRNEEMEKITQHVKKIITSIGEEEGYDLLLPFHPGGLDVIHVSNQVDITSKVKKKL